MSIEIFENDKIIIFISIVDVIYFQKKKKVTDDKLYITLFI